MFTESGERQHAFTAPGQPALDWNGVKEILQTSDQTHAQLEMGEPDSGIVKILYDPTDVLRLFNAVNRQVIRAIELVENEGQNAAEMLGRRNFFLMSATFWFAQAVHEGSHVSVVPVRRGDFFIKDNSNKP